MRKLIEGVRSFVSTVHQSERELFEQLASGQTPETLFITCSDSRVCPSLLTGAGPGELFVVRNAGNIVPVSTNVGGEAASVEYAVSVLKVRDVIVCGHSDCGAMKAVLDPASVSGLPAVAAWVEHSERVREIVDQRPDLSPSLRLERAIEANVLTQLTHLQSHPCVADAVRRRELRLHAWVWDIGSGRMRAFDADRGAFVDLLEHHSVAAE